MHSVSVPDGHVAIIFRSPDDLAEIAALLAERHALQAVDNAVREQAGVYGGEELRNLTAGATQ